MVFGSYICFGGRPQNFGPALKNSAQYADHHAKFCANQLTHLGDLTLKGKFFFKSAVKHKFALKTIISG